jgi:branched-subunit amino acid ABC-type transport system permease component
MAGTRYAVLPDMGLRPVFYAFVVAFLASVASKPLKFLIVGLLVGVGESISVLWLSTSMTQVLVFGILFLFVAFRALDSIGGPFIRRARTLLGGAPAKGVV